MTPHSSLRRRRSQISSSPATGSSWEVGSSSRTSRGRVTSAAASATRCSSPPERVSTVRSSRCGIARARATSSTARARAAGGVAAHLQRQLDLGGDRRRDDLGLGVLGDVADRGCQLARAGRDRVDAGDLDPARRSRRRGSAGRGRRRRAAASTCRRPSARRGRRTRRRRARGRRRARASRPRVRVGVGEAVDRERRGGAGRSRRLRHAMPPARSARFPAVSRCG